MDKVKDLGLKMEETDSEIRRINEEIRDQRQTMDEVERERMKFIGSDAYDHIRKLDNDIDRKRRDISRNNERVGDLMKRTAIRTDGGPIYFSIWWILLPTPHPKIISTIRPIPHRSRKVWTINVYEMGY